MGLAKRSHEGRRQNDCHGCKHGRQAAAGGGDGPQQSPQQRGRQTRDRCSKLPAVNSALGKVIASVPTSQVMDVYNAVGKITGSNIPNNLFAMSSPSEATAAYDALMQFKDV